MAKNNNINNYGFVGFLNCSEICLRRRLGIWGPRGLRALVSVGHREDAAAVPAPPATPGSGEARRGGARPAAGLGQEQRRPQPGPGAQRRGSGGGRALLRGGGPPAGGTAAPGSCPEAAGSWSGGGGAAAAGTGLRGSVAGDHRDFTFSYFVRKATSIHMWTTVSQQVKRNQVKSQTGTHDDSLNSLNLSVACSFFSFWTRVLEIHLRPPQDVTALGKLMMWNSLLES
ncbi:uncharacterized protein [Vulpes vulpes]|uniref:Uncharacterized protein n=1 Tax=Vulpes vulpes TaxID=9627 RepID=A0ABM4ZGI5_VULVU